MSRRKPPRLSSRPCTRTGSPTRWAWPAIRYASSSSVIRTCGTSAPAMTRSRTVPSPRGPDLRIRTTAPVMRTGTDGSSRRIAGAGLAQHGQVAGRELDGLGGRRAALGYTGGGRPLDGDPGALGAAYEGDQRPR